MGEQTILIVDDNLANLSVLTNLLEEQGLIVLIARDGESAIETAEYALPDIMLLDVLMPGIDGFEVCRQLKAKPLTQEIPIIFMTALTGTEDKIKGFSVGAVDYITKPIQYEEVIARVSTHLRLEAQKKRLQKLTLQQEISRQVSQKATSILDLDEMLTAVTQLIQTKFGYYFVSIWLLTKQKETAVLKASHGLTPLTLPFNNKSLSINLPASIIITVCQTGQSYLSNDVAVDDKYLATEPLSETRSELALPLQIGQDILGTLDIQSNQKNAFQPEDQVVLQGLANQISVAIQNARLYSLEKNLRRLEAEKTQELAQLNAHKDKFFSIISHDLRAPFNSLLSLSQLLSMGIGTKTEAETRDMAGKIHDSAKSTYNLLQNLLAWSLLQRDHIAYQPNELHLYEVAQEAIDVWMDTAVSKNIQLRNQIDPTQFALADKNMLATTIRNLVSNGIKFTPNGGQVTVTTQFLSGAAPKHVHATDSVKVIVTDTGIGMSLEDQQKLFQPHIHHTTSGTNQELGTGLGLLLCKEMVEKQGGYLGLETQVGQGTVIWFTLPASSVKK